jgi:hypothetical protein
MSAISSRREYTTQTPQHPKAHQKNKPQKPPHHPKTHPNPHNRNTHNQLNTPSTNQHHPPPPSFNASAPHTPQPPNPPFIPSPNNPHRTRHNPSRKLQPTRSRRPPQRAPPAQPHPQNPLPINTPYPHPRHAPHRPTPSTASRPTQTPSASNETPPPTPNAATPSTTTAPLAPCLAAATLGRSPRADAPDPIGCRWAGRSRASLGVCARSRPCEASPACPTLRYRPARRPRPAAAVARHALPRGATRAHAAGWQSSPLFRHGARWDWHSGRWGRRAASLPSRSVGLCAVRERTGCWQDGMSRGCWGWKCLCAGRWCHRGRRSVGSVGDSGWG